MDNWSTWRSARDSSGGSNPWRSPKISNVPSRIFQRIDTRYIASALADNTTHAGLSTFELSLGDFESAGNKGERASQIVSEILKRSDTDALILELLNYLFVENPYAVTSEQNTSYQNLLTKVLNPRGIALTDNGYVLPDGLDIDSVKRGPATQKSETPVPPRSEPITNFFSPPTATTARAVTRDPKKIFVVHGRDPRPVDVLAKYLQFLHLEMMTWSAAVDLAEGTQPHTYDIVKAGIDNAAAVIVIFSPDDLARIKDAFSTDGDPDRKPTGQARPNVLLEAGMAFALARERTIFLQSSKTRPISDIAGFNWVKLDGDWDSRSDLKNRLVKADADVRKGNFNLMDPLAGPFRVSP